MSVRSTILSFREWPRSLAEVAAGVRSLPSVEASNAHQRVVHTCIPHPCDHLRRELIRCLVQFVWRYPYPRQTIWQVESVVCIQCDTSAMRMLMMSQCLVIIFLLDDVSARIHSWISGLSIAELRHSSCTVALSDREITGNES